MMEICGTPVIELIYKRLSSNSSLAGKIKVLTSDDPSDLGLVSFLNSENIPFFCGPLSDVLKRYRLAAEEDHVDTIVRITADCPLVDPQVVEQVIELYSSAPRDTHYGSNVWPRSFPKGLDVEIFSMESLRIADDHALLPYEREHVTPYILNHFKKINLLSSVNLSHIRATLDTPDDFDLIQNIYASVNNNSLVLFSDWSRLLSCPPMQCHTFQLRPVASSDSRLIYNWQMAPGMRLHSRNPEAFDFNSHCRWVEDKLNTPEKSFLYIANDGNADVAFVRIDLTPSLTWEVSILVAKEFHGMGYGKKSLFELRKLHPNKIFIAYVKHENISSRKLFESAGYKPQGDYYYLYPITSDKAPGS